MVGSEVPGIPTPSHVFAIPSPTSLNGVESLVWLRLGKAAKTV